MARKSRKQGNEQSVISISGGIKRYRCGIYARLSLLNGGKEDNGDTIENQIRISKQYAKEHNDLQVVDVYVDNGKKGTSFDRPEFRRLMEDIKSGRIDGIIVKDLSRFGRDYLEAGEYLEKIFPFMGVRFIAVTDGYDSFGRTGGDIGMTVPLKNMVNELYAKDISQKICTSIHSRMEKGEFLSGKLCYGYLRSETDKYRMVIDPETAKYVRLMFEMRAEGKSLDKIREHLDSIHAITPSRRKAQLQNLKPMTKVSDRWNTFTIKTYLEHPVYLGHMVYGRVKHELYKGDRESRYLPKLNGKSSKICMSRLLQKNCLIRCRKLTVLQISGLKITCM